MTSGPAAQLFNSCLFVHIGERITINNINLIHSFLFFLFIYIVKLWTFMVHLIIDRDTTDGSMDGYSVMFCHL
jgi:hypothetical protein